MATEDDIAGDRLLLPPCRPTLMGGVPLEAALTLGFSWACGLVLFGAVVTGTGVCLMAYYALRALIADDFNAVSVFLCYARTKLKAQKSLIWTGVTLDPLFGQRRNDVRH